MEVDPVLSASVDSPDKLEGFTDVTRKGKRGAADGLGPSKRPKFDEAPEKDMPRILVTPTRVYLAVGTIGRLDCPASANPPVTHVVWSINDKALDLKAPSRFRLGLPHSLIIDPVTRRDEARYSCVPYSSLGPSQSANTMQVFIRDPPVFTTKPLPYYQKAAGDNITVPCSAEGDPNPVVAWKRKQGLIISDGRVKVVDGNLTLTSLEVNDEGTYECVATNVVMSIVSTAILVVLRANEKAPTHRLSGSSGQDHVVLSWLPPLRHDRGRHLFIWYQLVGGKQEWQSMSLSGIESNSVPIYSLQSNTTYQFVVHSTTNNGREIFHPHPLLVHTEPIIDEKSWSDDSTRGNGVSHVFNAKEREQDYNRPNDPKLHPPTNVSASYWSHSGINITWSPPSDQPAYYIIEYKTVGKWVNLTEKPVSGQLTFYHWRTPSRGTTYRFRLVGVDSTMTRFSQPSQDFALKTFADPDESSAWRPNNSVIVVIIALTIAALLALIMILIFGVNYFRRIRKTKRLPYGHVKYSGANESTRNSSPSASQTYAALGRRTSSFSTGFSHSASQTTTTSAVSGVVVMPTTPGNNMFHEATVVANTHPFDRHLISARHHYLNHRHPDHQGHEFKVQDLKGQTIATSKNGGSYSLQDVRNKSSVCANPRQSPERKLVETLI